MTPGLCSNIPAAEYHADCCEQPSLSSSIINILCSRSPWHAWTAHPKLNPEYVRQESERFDLGTAAHAFILEGATNFTVIDAPDYRTRDAQFKRDAARVAGYIPLLRAQWDQVLALASALGPQLSQLESPRPFTTPGGQPEQTLIWQEEGVHCRARLDWLHDDHRTVDDLKTVGGSANPSTWSRTLFTMGYDTQAAWYLRGVKAVLGTDAQFRFILVETEPPYAVSCVALGPDALDLANKKITYALGLWRHCLETNTWPGYPAQTCYADVPPWEAMAWGERLYQAPIVDDGRDLGDLLA